jgi:hypothetical protein
MGKEWDSPNTFPLRDRGELHGGSLPKHTPHKHGRGFANGVTFDKTRRGRDAFLDFLTPILAECLRVCRPGAVGLVWALPRTSHWTALAIEESGWVLCDKLLHLFGSGFPKGRHLLKPAYEEWWLCRKPGPLWLGVEECRVSAGDGVPLFGNGKRDAQNCYANGLGCDGRTGEVSHAGRWPANLVLSHISPSAHSPGCRLVGTRRVRTSSHRYAEHGTHEPSEEGNAVYGAGLCSATPNGACYVGPDGTEEVEHWMCDPECPILLLDRQGEERGVHFSGPAQPAQEKWAYDREGANCYADGTFRAAGARVGDRGGPSRFFYCAKASKADRGEGNKHPCVKPSALMEWLCRLSCPAGGLVLDPFMGSGSTALACLRTGRRFLGIEQDAAYHATAAKRLVEAQGPLFAGVGTA